MIGAALTLSVIGVIGAVSVSFAHENEGNSMRGSGMMSGNMMHSMVMDGNGMMGRMKMMDEPMIDEEVTQEKMEEMMEQMDKDGDGLCDYCGMPVAMCGKMMGYSYSEASK